MHSRNVHKLPVLVVEPQQAHQDLIAHCLRETISQAQPTFKATAGDALLYLAQQASQPGRLPRFIFLGSDLSEAGLSLLGELRRLYPYLVLIVLADFKQAEQVYEAYRIGANTVLIKPATIPAWEELFTRIESYWFGIAVWPLPE